MRERGSKMSKVTVISKFFGLAWLIFGIGGTATPAQADSPYDFSTKQRIGPGQTLTGIVRFTKDGAFNGEKEFEFVNSTNMTVTKTFTATAPAGTNDRGYGIIIGSTRAANILPPRQIADYSNFLAANGFIVGSNTLDSPVAIGDLNRSGALDSGDVATFALIENINSFVPYADESNFPLGSLFTTDSGGHVPELPGLTFYQDASLDTPYANSQLFITGIIAEAVPEPGIYALMLTGLGVIGFLAERRRKAVAV
jgi:hypothetical protein